MPFWKTLTLDRVILAHIEGVQLEFVEGATEKLHRDCEPYYFEGSKQARIEANCKKMLMKCIIEEIRSEHQHLTSPIFTRDKEDGGLIIILDLTELNKCKVYDHFKMDALKLAWPLSQRIATWLP